MRKRLLLALGLAFDMLAFEQPARAQANEPQATTTEASAEEAAVEEASAEEASPPEATSHDQKRKKSKKGKTHRLQLKGRIIARAQLTSRRLELVGSDLLLRDHTLKSLDLSVPSARLGFHYDSHIPGLSATASVEFRDKPKLKDGYLQAKTRGIGLRFGQFKVPGSPFETASRLSLPSADRGFIHDILSDRLEIGGRRPGLTGFGKLKLQKAWLLELTLGAFQGSYLRDEATRDRSLLMLRALGAQTIVARVETAWPFARLGVTGNYRVGTNELLQADDEPDHFWSGGIDASVDAWLGRGGLRVWADVNIGESWFVAEKRRATGRPRYTAVRAMAAFRGGGRTRGDVYVEPYVMAGGFDPDAKVKQDLALEAAAGVGVGFWQRGHLTLQGGLTRTQRNFPVSFVLPDQRDQKNLLLQLGVPL